MPVKVEPETLSKELWILAYDVPSENIQSLRIADRRWLQNQRWKVHDAIRFGFSCPMLQKSLYRASEDDIAQMRELIKKWQREYEDKNFEALIELYPIRTTDRGYKAFVMMQLDCTLHWLGSVQEIMGDAIDAKKISRKAFYECKRKLRALEEIIEKFMGPKSPDFQKARYKRLRDELLSATDVLRYINEEIRIVAPGQERGKRGRPAK